MKRLTKTKLIWLAVALVPLLVAVASCSGDDVGELPLYTPVPAETCEIDPNTENEVVFSPGFLTPINHLYCVPIPNSNEYMHVEINHPVVKLAGICGSSDVRCCTIQSFYLDLLATNPTLTADEAMRLFNEAEEMLLVGLDEQQEIQPFFFFTGQPCRIDTIK